MLHFLSDAAMNIGFDPMAFVENLKYMGIGMLGIFLVMGILILGTAALNKVTGRNRDSEN